MHKQILNIAIPSILTNIAIPLLGLADTAIVGHLGSATYIAAIALGSTLISMAYWGFGFLRMSTGGLTAQAFGEANLEKCCQTLLRSLAWALSIAALLLLFHRPLVDLALLFAGEDANIKSTATTYFNIVIWGAPAVLMNNSICGWLIGMQKARPPLYTAIFQNAINIVFSLILVFGWHLKVEGVALGTLIAQYLGVALALYFAIRTAGRSTLWRSVQRLKPSDLLDRKFASSNRDIFARSMCLLAVTSFFTFAGARQGETFLAANALLMQFFLLFSYFMDGFAYAGEALCGKFHGAKEQLQFQHTVKALFLWGAGLSLLFTCVYAIAGDYLIGLLTDVADVRAMAHAFLCYAIAVPLISFAAFLYDGIFIGISATRAMLYAMGSAMALFFATYFMLPPNNHTLWVAFLLYLLTRSMVSYIYAQSHLKSVAQK